MLYSKTATLKRPTNGFQDQLLLNAGLKYCRKLGGAFCNTLTFIDLPFVFKTFCFVFFQWPFYTGFEYGKFSLNWIRSKVLSLK